MRVPVRQVSSEPTLLKYIGPFDQITIVVCLVPGKVERETEPMQYIKNVNYIRCECLVPEHSQCRTFKVENKAI